MREKSGQFEGKIWRYQPRRGSRPGRGPSRRVTKSRVAHFSRDAAESRPRNSARLGQPWPLQPSVLATPRFPVYSQLNLPSPYSLLHSHGVLAAAPAGPLPCTAPSLSAALSDVWRYDAVEWISCRTCGTVILVYLDCFLSDRWAATLQVRIRKHIKALVAETRTRTILVWRCSSANEKIQKQSSLKRSRCSIEAFRRSTLLKITAEPLSPSERVLSAELSHLWLCLPLVLTNTKPLICNFRKRKLDPATAILRAEILLIWILPLSCSVGTDWHRKCRFFSFWCEQYLLLL